MRSRTIREGSVGLLILAGLAVFIGLVLWLRNLSFGNNSYKFIISFTDAVGMKEGATVRFRGVGVGRVTQVKSQTNGVDTTVEITDPNLLIPKNVTIEANQSGFVGETSIDITPPAQPVLSSNSESLSSRNSKCNSTLFICDRDRVQGRIGVSFIELLRSGTNLASRYGDPAFFNNVNALTKNASIAAVEASKLTAELALLSRSARQELGTFSTAAKSVTRTSNQTLAQVGNVATRFGNTADQYSLTATQLSRLASSANDLLISNRGNLVGTLDSVRQTSDQLRQLLGSFTPVVAQLNSTAGQLNSATGQIKVGELVKNLETLSANAAQASANLRDITTSLNNPNNVVLLQQTLDSARATFENTQKITADLDELTGDPAFRENVKKLVNGLGKLVSTTQQLQQEVRVAEQLEPVSTAINTTVSSATVIPATKQQPQPKVEPTIAVTPANMPQPVVLFPPAAKKPSPQATSEPINNSNR